MKRIIEGKVYETDKAIRIGEYDNGLSGSDFNTLTEALYRTNSGQYFLAGSGGANTKYSVANGDRSFSNGSRIFVLNRDEAFEWACGHMDADDVVAEFGDLVKEA